MEKKKILFIQHTMTGGGAEKVLTDILNEFDYSRYSVTLLLKSMEGVYLPKLPKDVKVVAIKGENIKQLPPLPKIRLINNRFTRPFWKYLDTIRALRGFHFYDVIISFMEGSAVYHHSQILHHGKRNISWVHIDLKANHYTSRYFDKPDDEETTYKKMDKIVFVSNDARTEFKKLFNIPDDKTVVIYNIINRANIIKQSEQSSDFQKKHKFTICNIGRLTKQKRQDKLLQTAKILIEKYGLDVEVLILGEGELKAELESYAIKYGIADRINFMGFRNNPYSILKEADLFLLTSEAEGFSLVVAEAMCLGVPVVSTKVTGPIELLKNDAGVLTGFEPEEISLEVKNLLTNPEKLAYYRQRSLEQSKIFQPESTMTQIYNLIEGNECRNQEV